MLYFLWIHILKVWGDIMIEENNQNENKPKKIEIVKGNSKDLNISEVRDNLVLENPEERLNNQNIIIPENIENNTETPKENSSEDSNSNSDSQKQ